MDIHNLLRHRWVGDGVGHTRTMLWASCVGAQYCACASPMSRSGVLQDPCGTIVSGAGIYSNGICRPWCIASSLRNHCLWCWDIQQRYLETGVYCKFPAEPLPLVQGYTATVSGDRGVLLVPCGTIASGAGIHSNDIWRPQCIAAGGTSSHGEGDELQTFRCFTMIG